MRRWRSLLILLVGLAVLGFLRVRGASRGPAADPVRDYSSLRANRWGTRVLRQLCSQFGLDPVVWRKPFSDLAPEDPLLVVLNPFRAVSTEEFAALESWVSQGGHLVVAVRDASPTSRGDDGRKERLDGNHAILAWLGLVLKERGWSVETESVEECPWQGYRLATLAAPGAVELAAVRSRAEVRRHLAGRDAGEEVLADLPAMATVRALGLLRAGGRVLGVSLSLGQGTVDVLGDVNVLSNAYIGKADNVLLAGLLVLRHGPSRVLFDEYHHGFGAAGSSKSARSRRALGATILLLLGALFVCCLGSLWRMGRAQAFAEKPRRSVAEYVHAVASLYQRANQRKAALATLAAAVRRRWALRLGIPPNSSPEQFALAARRRRLSAADALERVFSEAAGIEALPEVPRDQFARLGAQLARLQADLDRQELSRHG